MPFVIALITFVFVCVAFLSKHPFDSTQNPFFVYTAIQIQFILSNLFFSLAGFIVLILFFMRSKIHERHHPFNKKFSVSLFHTFQVLVVGFLGSFVVLYGIAFIQLNILSLTTYLNPTVLGIQTDRKSIAHTLSSNGNPPDIVASDPDKSKELLSVASVITGTDNFYGKDILLSIPGFVVLPMRISDSHMIFLDNTLIFTQVTPDDMEAIGPILGYLYVKKYFWNRAIRSYPKFLVMGKSEYLESRKQDSIDKSAMISQNLLHIESTISSLSAQIQTEKNTLENTTDSIQHAKQQKDTQYRACLGSQHTLEYCKNLLVELTNAIPSDKDLPTLTQHLASDQKQLEDYQYYDKFFKVQVKLVQNLKGNIPHELGVFEPESTIKLILDSSDSHSIGDDLETLIHEYLHYASYTKGKNLTGSFFEEGLTEYFARNIVRDNLNTSTNLGYPVHVKIISEISKTIADTELADIYFSKDETRLEETLDRVYGDGFYKNNQILFESLQYASDPKQILKLANQIMSRIGGSPLTQKDLYSTPSNL